MNRREFCIGTTAGIGIMSGNGTASVDNDYRAIDSHTHVFLRNLHLAASYRYAPDYDASIDSCLSLLDANGIARAVLVQPSFLGTDNTYMMDALAAQPARFRAIVVVAKDISRAEIDTLRRKGAVGARLNLIGQPSPNFADPKWRGLLEEFRRVDWLVEVQVEAARLPPIAQAILDRDLRLVVDHFGRPDMRLGIDDPGFRYLRSLGVGRRTWVKMSGEYRLAPGEAGQALARAAAQALLKDLGADRLTWGSDWPHTQFETVAIYSRARDALNRWIPDEIVRRKVLTSNAERLFGFDHALMDRSHHNLDQTVVE